MHSVRLLGESILGHLDWDDVYSKLQLLAVFLPADLEDRAALAEMEMFQRNLFGQL